MLNPNYILQANRGGNHLIRSRAKFFDSHCADSGMSIKWTLKGTEYYQVGGREHEVPANHFLVVNPGQPVHFFGDSEDFIEGVCIYLDGTVLADIHAARETKLKNQLAMGGEVPAFTQLLNEMVWGLQDNLFGMWLANLQEEDLDQTDEAFFYAVGEMLFFSEQLERRKVDQINAAKTHTKIELYRRLSLAATYIRDNFKEPLDLNELSKIACLSKFHLIRTFRKLHGKSPMQLLYDCRLEYAKAMLRKEPYLDLRTAAEAAGFPSRRSLTRKLGDWPRTGWSGAI